MNAAFDELTAFIPPPVAPRRPGFRRWRLGPRLVRPLPPVEDTSRQGVRVDAPIEWRQRGADIAEARFVELSADVEPAVVASLVPVLFSGRPVAVANSPSISIGSGRSLHPVDPIEACRWSETRLALAAHSQLRQLFGVDADGFVAPTIAVVMSTNRPQFVARAVAQMQSQCSVDIELHVALHGCARSDIGEIDFERGAVRSATVHEFAGDELFGSVLRRTSDEVSAAWLSKWDDDDLYGPHHLIDLWLAAVLSRAPLVGKAAEFVLIDDDVLVRRRGGRTYASTRFLAGGALLMSRQALEAVGSWGAVPRSVDQDLIERFELSGWRTLRIHGYEFGLVRHGHGHTWDAGREYFLSSADEIWSAAAIERIGVPDFGEVVDGVRPEASGSHGRSGPVSTATVCVPNKDGQDAMRLWQRRSGEWPECIDLVVCDDRSAPPLVVDGPAERLTLVRAPEASGFRAGRARNLAAAQAGGDVLVFVDADLEVGPEVLEEVLGLYAGGFRGAVHATIAFAPIDPAEAWRVVDSEGFDRLRTTLAASRTHGQLWRERHFAASADLSQPRSTSFRATVGAFLAVDRATFDRIGGFRDVDVRGVEDTEFGYRLLASGCEQLVLRNRNIVHLGPNTFSNALKAEQALDREPWMAAWIPIWSRDFSERRAALSDGAANPVPFVEIPHDFDLAKTLNDVLGPGTATAVSASRDVSDGAFAIALELDEAVAADAVRCAYSAFRQRSGGEVVVTRDDRVVGHFVAMWSARRARRVDGGDPMSDPDRTAIEALLPAIRRSDGSMYRSL